MDEYVFINGHVTMSIVISMQCMLLFYSKKLKLTPVEVKLN